MLQRPGAGGKNVNVILFSPGSHPHFATYFADIRRPTSTKSCKGKLNHFMSLPLSRFINLFSCVLVMGFKRIPAPIAKDVRPGAVSRNRLVFDESYKLHLMTPQRSPPFGALAMISPQMFKYSQAP